MGLIVESTIFPLRVSLRDKDSWELVIDITNAEEKATRVQVEIDLPKQVTFTRAGYSTRYENKLDNLKPGDSISLKIPIFVSRHGVVGDYGGIIKITEHYSEYGYVTNTYNKEVLLRIVP
ncbi:hypothetical protein KKE06_05560 [Candidatus Micrarchaeota archaeon]|nr:hypothetical protein [Candidatus Micrarchaeota archaeon]MBU1930594.1 hypothetical protein [Candidatus Micrarchaeota archaeon]